MHSKIFQITEKQVEKEHYLNENTLEQGDSVFIDYCSEIDDEEREECIAYLVENILPKGMFTRMEANVIRYNGGMEQWKEEAVANIKKKTSAITANNYFGFRELHALKEAIVNPLDTGYLFYTDPDGVERWAEKSHDFMYLVNSFKVGTLLYIGGVIDYHI